MGADEIDRRPATVLTFTQPSYPAWYRLWADRETGRILRLEMRAEKHVMDQRYARYGAPLEVEAPRRSTRRQ